MFEQLRRAAGVFKNKTRCKIPAWNKNEQHRHEKGVHGSEIPDENDNNNRKNWCCPIANIRGRWRITKAKMVPRSITIHNYATERQRQTKRLGKRMKTRWKLRSLKARHCSTPVIYDSESKPGTAEKEIPLYGTHKAREFNNLIIKKLIIINTNNQMSVNRGENRSKYRYSVKKWKEEKKKIVIKAAKTQRSEVGKFQ